MPVNNKISILSIIVVSAAMMVFSSCHRKEEVAALDMSRTPAQVVHNMDVIRTRNSTLLMRMTSPIVQSYEYYSKDDSLHHKFDLYPTGIHVDAYTEDGALETVVDADHARHEATNGANIWVAFGNVKVKNIINNQTITSDTIWWDQKEKKIYTDCYVKIVSPKGLLQGYGMVSDERANNTVLRKPFDSFSAPEDTSRVEMDTLNFIGPLRKK